MPILDVTRRGFMGALAWLPALMSGGTEAVTGSTVAETKFLPIHDLNLSPEEIADLEEFAAPVLREAHRLDELNLGNLPVESGDPGFIFTPE
jgi:hypothetical protein